MDSKRNEVAGLEEAAREIVNELIASQWPSYGVPDAWLINKWTPIIETKLRQRERLVWLENEGELLELPWSVGMHDHCSHCYELQKLIWKRIGEWIRSRADSVISGKGPLISDAKANKLSKKGLRAKAEGAE